jgi:hypothetical protein
MSISINVSYINNGIWIILVQYMVSRLVNKNRFVRFKSLKLDLNTSSLCKLITTDYFPVSCKISYNKVRYFTLLLNCIYAWSVLFLRYSPPF